jgi:hypothetical protein
MEFVKLLISFLSLAISAAGLALHFWEVKHQNKSAKENDRPTFSTVTIIFFVIFWKE